MKKYKLLILALFLMLPMSVNAHEITCDSGTLNYLDKFNCYLKTSGGEFDQISGTLTVDNPNVTCNVTSIGPSLTNSKTTPEFFIEGKTTANTAVATFGCQVTGKVTSGQTAQVLINDYKYHIKGVTYLPTELVLRSDYLMLAPYVEESTTTKPAKPKDTSNIRSTLKSVSDENVKINFSRITLDYRVEVMYEVEQLNLVIYPYDINANVEIVGDQKLQVGENVIDIYVTSPDGTAKTCYTFVFVRLPRGQEIYYKESDSSLADLTIEGHPIKFESKITEYTIDVHYTVKNLNVTATPTVATASAEISGTENIENNGKIFINVTSQDGTSTTRYVINIRKGSPPKDYTTEIVLGIIIIAIILIIVLIINTSKKEKSDDLLKIKHEKRKVKKGKTFDENDVPEVGTESVEVVNKVVSSTPAQTVVIEQNNTAQPIQVVEQVDTNLNKVTPVQPTISLETTQKAQPIEMTQPVVIENTVVSGLDEKAPTLDLTNASVESSMVQPQMVQPLPAVEPTVVHQPQIPIEQVVHPIVMTEMAAQPIPVVEQPVVAEPQMVITQQPVVTEPQVVYTQQPVVTQVVTTPVVEPVVQVMPTPVAEPVVEPILPEEPVVEDDPQQYITQPIIIPAAQSSVVEEPVVEEDPQQYVTQQIVIPAVQPSMPEEPVVVQEEVVADPVIEQQITSVIPITPTTYKLPEDQELAATQALQIINEPQVIDDTTQQQ